MSEGPGDEQRPPEWQRPQWQQPDQPQWSSQQPPWGQQQQPYYYQPGPQTPGAATAALILGICSLILCPLCAPFAIFYGSRARKDIDASDGRLTGRGLGTAGVVLGWVAIGLTVLFIVFLVIGLTVASNSSP
jgi:Domain of unknown function (DUF4190)